MDASKLQDALATRLLTAAKIVEEQVEDEINRLENLDDDDLETIRQRRLQQMKRAQQQRNEQAVTGHGKYEEVADEKEFFEATKKSDKVVCLFYLDSNMRCKIVDKHFNILCRKHFGTRFIKVNAEKVHFLVTRLNIRVIPTIAVVMGQKTVDYIRGFDEVGGIDEFKTEALEDRLAKSGVIEVDRRRPEQQKAKKSIRSGKGEYDNEEDW